MRSHSTRQVRAAQALLVLVTACGQRLRRTRFRATALRIGSCRGFARRHRRLEAARGPARNAAASQVQSAVGLPKPRSGNWRRRMDRLPRGNTEKLRRRAPETDQVAEAASATFKRRESCFSGSPDRAVQPYGGLIQIQMPGFHQTLPAILVAPSGVPTGKRASA